MKVKDKVVHAVQGLPEDASIEDAMERFFFVLKLKKESSKPTQARLFRMLKFGREWQNG